MPRAGQEDTDRSPTGRKPGGQLVILARWAEWGREYTREHARPPRWSGVESLIEAAQPWLADQSRDLRSLLECSADSLKLADPLLCHLGPHRWLDKETSYSDWLAWVLESLGNAREVARVLGVEDSQFLSMCTGQSFRVQREVQVRKGLPECTGQIDLLIAFGEPTVALLGVEVKTFDEQYRKQCGYMESLKELCSCVECVLIANTTSVPEGNLFGFRLREWRRVAIELRRAIAGEVRNDEGRQITHAMILGFVAAVEQNLVGLGTVAPRRAWRGMPTPCPPELAEYLKEVLESR